jgi:spermidine/putrescine transport system permease protein
MRFKISALLLLFSLSVFAQSNLTYELKVGTTAENTLLSQFPESYAGEKVNVKLKVESLESRDLDFVFTSEMLPPVDHFDSIYSYTDESDVQWIVWQSNKEIKNRAQRVLVVNAYKTFDQYVREHTAVAKRNTGWIWFVFAGLLLLAGIAYACWIVYQRRAEKKLSSVEQETLRRKRMGLRRHYGSQLYLWLLLLVLYAPIALIAVFSFTKSKILGNWTGFSLDLYVNLFTGKADAGLNSAIWYTVIIALIAAVCSTILGTLAAIGIYNMRARQRKIVSLMNSVPMINPDIITGISLFLLFVALGFSQGLATVCIAHVVFCTPYVVLSVLPRLSRMNPNTYEAALDLGATPAQALRMVMLPELWPGMLSGFILALTLSVDDFGVTFFTKGSGGLETLSTFIYSDARKGGLTPELRPLFTIILLVMLSVLIYINIRNKKQEEK